MILSFIFNMELSVADGKRMRLGRKRWVASRVNGAAPLERGHHVGAVPFQLVEEHTFDLLG